MKPFLFNYELGTQKPKNFHEQNDPCPFCRPETLTQILDTDGDIIWLMNKYPVYEQTWPTVIVEGLDDNGEFSAFTPEYACRVLKFSLNKWYETLQNKDFKSVVYFKNFGPRSGGSLKHPHSQIMGLYEHDYHEYIKPQHFEGLNIINRNGVSCNLSTFPLIGFYEFNIIAPKTADIAEISRQLQGVLKYVVTDFFKSDASYNYYFYDLYDDNIYIKIIPRDITSPIFTGYGIPQITDQVRSQQIITEIRKYL